MKNLLDFEKPIFEIQSQLDELRKNADSLGLSSGEEIEKLEEKLAETRRQIFSNLTAWQRVQLARHPKRPYTLDYVQRIATDFIELHGDRRFSGDCAIV